MPFLSIVVAILLGGSTLAIVLFPLYQGMRTSLPDSFEQHARARTKGTRKGPRIPTQPPLPLPAPLPVTVGTGVDRRWQGAPCGCPPRPTSRHKKVSRREGERSTTPALDRPPALQHSLAASTNSEVEREQAARTALQEVELDFQLGNLAETDYRALRDRYMRRALIAMKSRHDREQELDEAIEEQLRRMRETDDNATETPPDHGRP